MAGAPVRGGHPRRARTVGDFSGRSSPGVINSDQTAYANAALPLTQRADLPTIYGTRHRAAMGLTERPAPL
ncbi:MAG: DNA integrity scanning protein DisA nucleotide-binding domain protein [Bryobacteraceae bacterium]|nr:DNA integrity scanning protein DisA nucleotide-binding domain protein [Bryobacteraceae bacterium]